MGRRSGSRNRRPKRTPSPPARGKENRDPRKGSAAFTSQISKHPPKGSPGSSSSDSSFSDSEDPSDDDSPSPAERPQKKAKENLTSNTTVGGSGSRHAKANPDDDRAVLQEEFRKTQELVDRLREQQKDAGRHLADLSNEKTALSRKRKHSSTKDEAIEYKVKGSTTTDISMKEIDRAGKHFAIQFHLFISVKELQQVVMTKKYAPEKRFNEGSEMEQQGLIHDILQLLPGSLAKKCRKQKGVDEWILRRMKSAMSTERSLAVRRIRRDIGHKIFACTDAAIINHDERGEHAQLGGRGLQAGTAEYFDVDILHSNYSGKFDMNSIFLNPVLMQAYTALVFGPDCVDQVMKGQPPSPIVETSSAIWSLKEITPGAIASVSVLVLYAIGPDRSFRNQGGVTGFDWDEIHRQYFKYLWKGKIEKRRSVLNVFRTWNDVLYPNQSRESEKDKGKKKPTLSAERALDDDERELTDIDEEKDGTEEVVGAVGAVGENGTQSGRDHD